MAVNGVRSIKELYGLTHNHCPEIVLDCENQVVRERLVKEVEYVQFLTPCGKIHVTSSSPLSEDKQWSQHVTPDFKVLMKLSGQVDIGRETQKIEQKLNKLEATKVKLETRLSKSKRPSEEISNK